MGQGGEYFKVGGSSFGRSQSRTPTAATRPSRKLWRSNFLPLIGGGLWGRAANTL